MSTLNLTQTEIKAFEDFGNTWIQGNKSAIQSKSLNLIQILLPNSSEIEQICEKNDDLLENFGNAWKKLMIIEDTISNGNGVSFLQYEAIINTQKRASKLKDSVLRGK